MCRWPLRTPTSLYSMHTGRSCIGSISGLPVFTKVPPSLATPVQGTTFQVTCQADGYPRPAITWTRVGMPLPAGKTSINQGTLTINNLSPADNGFYDCVATNIMGTKKKRINLAVQVRSGLYSRHRLTLYIPNSIKGCFGNWALGIWAYGTHCNELLERPPNNSFPARNYTMPKARMGGTLRPVMQIFLSSLRSWLNTK